MKPTDIRSALEMAVPRLAGVSETPQSDGRTLLAHLLERPPVWVLTHPEALMQPAESQALELALARLEQGEPLPYVLGEWEFFGRAFAVTPATLIPRPETELLVESALEWLRTGPGGRLAVDIGAGSGCIGISLAMSVMELRVIASDVSLPALQVAKRNVLRHGVESRVYCLQADLLPSLDRRIDLLCANLPYIPSGTLPDLRVARWEPLQALDGGPTGLDLIERLLAQAAGCMAASSLLLLEIEASLGELACALSCQAFPQAEVRLLKDLAGLDRLVRIKIAD